MTYCEVEYLKPGKKPRKLIKRRIKLGNKITPLIHDVFSNGQCHALAVALHEILGWPVMGTFGYGEQRTSHFVILQPPMPGRSYGLTGDINGLRCVDYNMRKANVDVILGGRLPKGWLFPNMKFARHYAPIIVKSIIEKDKLMRETTARGEEWHGMA